MILFAILHILGTIIILFLFMIVTGLIESRNNSKHQEQVFSVAAIKLGVPVSELHKREHASMLTVYLINEYGTDKFKNRLSDLLQPLFIAFEILNYIAQIAIVVLSAYLVLTVGYDHAKYAWLAVPFAILMWFFVLSFGLVLKLATGRTPGEAKGARKIAEKLNSG